MLIELGHDDVVASPSSRRAWIEIDALELVEPFEIKSPSSRRAWIEIGGSGHRSPGDLVALLAEGVDRNPMCPVSTTTGFCRPPRGGRG